MSNCRDARLHEVGLVFGWVLVASLLIPWLLVVGALKSERNHLVSGPHGESILKLLVGCHYYYLIRYFVGSSTTRNWSYY